MTAYEMRISDWSSDGCSSDLQLDDLQQVARAAHHDVVRFAAGLVRLARLQGERLRLTALGAAEQLDALAPDRVDIEIGRAAGRERVCQYVSIWVGSGSINKKTKNENRL